MSRRCRRCLSTVENGRLRRCPACQAALPKKRRPKHAVGLDLDRSAFVEANGGYDGCWICRALGIEMAGKLQRDHWHNGPNAGTPRGILCPFHNLRLGPAYTPEFLTAALEYVRKAA